MDEREANALTHDVLDPDIPENPEKPMDRAEAMRFFGLEESATEYVLDQKYWQMIKQYRGDIKANREKLDEINEVYEIASGKRQEAVRDGIAREKAHKFFGKTAKEWRNHFYYSWWRYVLIACLLIVVFMMARSFFFTATIDMRIVAVGHFEKFNDQIVEVTKSEGWSLNPAVYSANLVVDNSEPADDDSMNGEIAATAFLSVKNDIILTDARSFPFFFANFLPIDDLYNDLKSDLTEEQMEGVEPIYFSNDEHYAVLDKNGFGDPDRVESDSDSERHIYGLMIDDPELISAMGFENRWKSDPPSLVFCLSASTENKEKAEKYLATIVAERRAFTEKDG